MIAEEGGRLHVSGPMTVDTATALAEEGASLASSAAREFDLAQVSRVDSAAVGVVLAWIRSANEGGQGIRLSSVPTSFTSLAHLYGVDEVLAPYLAAE